MAAVGTKYALDSSQFGSALWEAEVIKPPFNYTYLKGMLWPKPEVANPLENIR